MTEFRLVAGNGPDELFLAEPPDWTLAALCVGQWGLFDEPDADLFHKYVAPICAACPVRGECLSDAMASEVLDNGDPASAKGRSGVRGGLRPKDRAKLAAGTRCPDECSKGHPMDSGTAYFEADDGRGRWRCPECVRDTAVRQYGRRAERVPCAVCGTRMRRSSLATHYTRFHPGVGAVGVEREAS